MNATLSPKNQLESALREYEAAHKVWMNTTIFEPASVREEVARVKNAARAKYESAYRAANPTHILL